MEQWEAECPSQESLSFMTLNGHPLASHVAAARSISAYQSTHLSRYDARGWGCGMVSAIYRSWWCRSGEAGRGARAVGDFQKENNSFISAGASTG